MQLAGIANRKRGSNVMGGVPLLGLESRLGNGSKRITTHAKILSIHWRPQNQAPKTQWIPGSPPKWASLAAGRKGNISRINAGLARFDV